MFQIGFSTLPGAEKKRSEQKLEELYYNKDPEVLINSYVIIESKLKDDIVAFWPPVEFGQIYTYLIDLPGQFTKAKINYLQELGCF